MDSKILETVVLTKLGAQVVVIGDARRIAEVVKAGKAPNVQVSTANGRVLNMPIIGQWTSVRHGGTFFALTAENTAGQVSKKTGKVKRDRVGDYLVSAALVDAKKYADATFTLAEATSALVMEATAKAPKAPKAPAQVTPAQVTPEAPAVDVAALMAQVAALTAQIGALTAPAAPAAPAPKAPKAPAARGGSAKVAALLGK